jgi:hypothetical protein
MSCIPAKAWCWAGQRRIDLGRALLEGLVASLDCRPQGCQGTDRLIGQLRAYQPGFQRARRLQKVADLEIELLQHSLDLGLDQEARPARECRLPGHPHALVYGQGQRQIGELTRAGHVGDCWQQRALDHRPEKHVGREPLRLGGRQTL